ncbi:MAG: hypothetical protein A3F78_01935 [Burkholderiales bacterium RIFCSPLOWO2_12_FULL_61_40]|nr:MAG: hypothetical protein A3F78_01935 [Burkholderiales bacterium RIFCSPLOWO2_12_FULL_61_40]
MPFAPPSIPLSSDSDLPRAIARLASIGGIFIALLIPLVFFTLAYLSEGVRLEAALQFAIQGSHKPLPPSPGKKDSEVRSPQDIVGALSGLLGQSNLRLIAADQQLLVEQHHDLRPPLITRTAPLDLGNTQSRQLELSSSLRPLLNYAFLISVPGLLLGWMTFVVLKDVPMRAFRLALQEAAVRKTTEEQLAKSLSIFAATLESTGDGILVTDVLGRAVVANQRFLDLWNQPKSSRSGDADAQTMFALANQLRDPATFLATHKDLTQHIVVDHGAVLELRDGRLFEWNSRPQFIDGNVVGRVSSFRDISERKRAEALLLAEKEVLEMVVCGAPLSEALGVLARHLEELSGQMFCAIVFREKSESNKSMFAAGTSLPHTVSNNIIQHGQAALDTLFVHTNTREELQKHGLSDEYSGVIEDIAVNPVWSDYRKLITPIDIETGFAVSVHSTNGHLLGFIVAHYRKMSNQPPHDRELIWVAAHLTRIAIERRQAETQLRILAHYDALTLLPNRDLFRDRLKQALTQAERHHGQVAIMFLDLDRFKTINDNLGHDAGDVLLCEVSARLLACVREEDTVARLGGDEFTVILPQIKRPEDARVVASKIVEALAPAILLSGQEAFVTPSIGVTIYPSDSTHAESLLKNADTAMYRAKEEGGNGFRFFTPEMNTLAAGRLEMESGLRRALEREEFVVYYQAKFSLATETIIGAEALLRWNCPGRGLVSPGEFIPILEETGLIEPVGEWILKTVCTQIRAWQDDAMPPLCVAVNLSGRQLQHNNIATVIGAILTETGLNPRYLELEVTESMLMHNPKFAADMLTQIRTKGVVHIGVDDFGTGYSSLSYLKRFPIDALKLDKSFVDGLPGDQDDVAISRAVIALAHSLKLDVIAEGVETEEQLAFLQENGCDVIQGYIVSRPIPAPAFAKLVRERQQMTQWFATQLHPPAPVVGPLLSPSPASELPKSAQP